jgi:hypothetical protein
MSVDAVSVTSVMHVKILFVMYLETEGGVGNFLILRPGLITNAPGRGGDLKSLR